MSFIKRALGIFPTTDEQGQGYIPSPLGRLLGVDSRSGFQPVEYAAKKADEHRKILVLCTEERYLEMANGKKFSTGHNVQETAVPLMHLLAAGFEFDVVTPTGKPAILEQWSIPRKDAAVLDFLSTYQTKFDTPLALDELVESGLNSTSSYVALFLPGGHGAMVGLPDDENVARLVRWIHDSDRYLVAVCHGPAALMAASPEDGSKHPYAGYELCAFPDKLDKQSPSIGYLPGPMPWFQCEKLEEQGMRIVNDGADGATHVDRKLFSGDSPRACDQLGRMVAEALLSAEVHPKAAGNVQAST